MNWENGQFFPTFESHWECMRKYKNKAWKEGSGEKNESIEAVREAYNQISEDIIFNLVESFQRRMLKYFENNGDSNPH